MKKTRHREKIRPQRLFTTKLAADSINTTKRHQNSPSTHTRTSSTHSMDEEERSLSPELSEQEAREAAQRVSSIRAQKNALPEDLTLYTAAADRTAEAQQAYEELAQCTYQYKYLGSSGQDAMTCMCAEDLDEEGFNHACADDDCINRGTKIECVNDAAFSSCGDDCANQRFQKRQYAQIAIFQTLKKGYGVRVEQDLEPDAFVYEYIGEVIEEKAFRKRMADYDQQQLKHFYFMMLQKGEFIDATQKGSLGRFCNHSCNPNCYVEKWVVGDKLKMGIFAKRRIVKGEELTFNYNVDRYGADAQTCYCGEPNCIGVIGGKTQTEAASLLPVNISRALGSSVEEEQAFLKSLKDLGETPEDVNAAYLSRLEPTRVGPEEVPAVMSALLQAEDALIVCKLFDRIELSSPGVLGRMKSKHGFSCAARLLKFAYSKDLPNSFVVDDNLVLRVLSLLKKWKSSQGYLEKANIIPVVEELEATTKSQEVLQSCRELQEFWSTFEKYLKIAKKDPNSQSQVVNYGTRRVERRDDYEEGSNASATPAQPATWKEDDLPSGWFAAASEDGTTYYFNAVTQETSWEKPSLKAELKEKTERALQMARERGEEMKRQRELENQLKKEKEQSAFQKIIEEAHKLEQEKREKEQREQAVLLRRQLKKAEQLKRYASHSKSPSPMKSSSTPSSQHYGEQEFKRLWKRHFATYVPNMIKSYQDEVGHDAIKACAREIVDQLTEKEFKKDATRKPPTETLPSEKRKKLKAFTEPYMEKVVEKVRAKKRRAEEMKSASKKQHL